METEFQRVGKKTIKEQQRILDGLDAYDRKDKPSRKAKVSHLKSKNASKRKK